MAGIRDRLAEFLTFETEVLAISCDPVYSLRAFADQDGLNFPLLSDFWPHGEVARAYDVFDEAEGLRRAARRTSSTRTAWSAGRSTTPTPRARPGRAPAPAPRTEPLDLTGGLDRSVRTSFVNPATGLERPVRYISACRAAGDPRRQRLDLSISGRRPAPDRRICGAPDGIEPPEARRPLLKRKRSTAELYAPSGAADYGARLRDARAGLRAALVCTVHIRWPRATPNAPCRGITPGRGIGRGGNR